MTKRTLAQWEPEYKKLKAVAALLEMMSEHNATYIVKDTYLDFGQNWMWTTICRRGWNDCQVLSPRDWEDIMNANTPAEIAAVVDEIRGGKYFHD